MPETMADKKEGNGWVERIEDTKKEESEKGENTGKIHFRRYKYIEVRLYLYSILGMKSICQSIRSNFLKSLRIGIFLAIQCSIISIHHNVPKPALFFDHVDEIQVYVNMNTA